jgi:6-phosphogluconolactonase
VTTSKIPGLYIAATPDQTSAACAAFIEDGLAQALKANSRATLAISGGHTPTPMFGLLAKTKLDWSRIHLFWVDERCVPPTHEDSNFRLANEALVKPSGIPSANVHRILGEAPPEEAAKAYIEDIRKCLSLRPGELPAFDILHRGMGPDAHTASLFPGEPLIANRTDIAAHVWVEKMKMHRVTLLPGTLLAAKITVLQVEGTDKADPLYNVLFGPEDPMHYPCQIAARGSDRAVWFLDRDAAARISVTAEAGSGET